MHQSERHKIFRICCGFDAILYQFLPEYAAFSETEFGEGVKKEAWHLQWIGTRKSHRGRGFAAMLIDVIRDKVLCTFVFIYHGLSVPNHRRATRRCVSRSKTQKMCVDPKEGS